jgi:hypothetical protein
MEKMIGGVILCVLGGLGFLFSLSGFTAVTNTIVGIPDWELLPIPGLTSTLIIFLISIITFGVGIILIQSDREVEYYERY